jgi:hypothetical protein
MSPFPAQAYATAYDEYLAAWQHYRIHVCPTKVDLDNCKKKQDYL